MTIKHEGNSRETRSMRWRRSHRTLDYNQRNDKAVIMNTLHNNWRLEHHFWPALGLVLS